VEELEERKKVFVIRLNAFISKFDNFVNQFTLVDETIA
jgi:hypothetical protein